MLERTGLAKRIGTENFFYTESGALESLAARIGVATQPVPAAAPPPVIEWGIVTGRVVSRPPIPIESRFQPFSR